jgi:hypothetical protein
MTEPSAEALSDLFVDEALDLAAKIGGAAVEGKLGEVWPVAHTALVAAYRRGIAERIEQHDRAHQGHNEPCYYCGKPCDGLAGDPGQWPIGLCHAGDPGLVKYHHTNCIYEQLNEGGAAYRRGIEEAKSTMLEMCRMLGYHPTSAMTAEVEERLSALAPPQEGSS